MSSESSRENAFKIIESLREKYGDKASHIHNVNEATTRLLIIDEVLMALGWQKEDFNPESKSGRAGYIDYLLSIERVPRLIVEAKRTGNTFNTPSKNRPKDTYQLRYLRSAFKEPFSRVLEQAEKYSLETGVRYALITNGAEWILVQLLLIPGHGDLNDLRGFYFGNLFSGDFNFELLWDILYKPNVDNGSIEVNLGEKNTKEADFTMTPQNQLGHLQWQTVEFDQELREFYDLFFDEIIHSHRRNMLEKCFVTNTRLDHFDGELKRALKDTAPNFIPFAHEISPEEGDALVSHYSGDKKGRVVIVTGSVGCGKSTFVTRVLVRARHSQKDSLFALKIDLIDEVGRESQDITSILWNYITDKWKEACPESYHIEILKKIFGLELSNLRKGPYKDVFELDKLELAKHEAKLLDEFSSNPEIFFKNCWDYYRKRGMGIAIFFDNVDRASEKYQEQVYYFAHKLSRETGATVIVTMREFTFFRGREAGFLDVRTDDIVFHLQSPNLEQLISKRITYIEEHIQDDHRLSHWKKTKDWDTFYKGIKLHSDTLKKVFLIQNDGRKLLAILGSIAWHDVRFFLSTLRQIHYMLGSGKELWKKSEIIAALLTPTDRGRPIIGNLYRTPYPAYQCYYLKLRLLLMMQHGQSQHEARRGTQLNTILRFLKQYGYQQRWIKKAVEELVQERFLECLEAPAEEDYTKNYVLAESHSFRPSPLAIESINEIILDPVYLALTGNDLPFHSEFSFRKYEQIFHEFLEMLMKEGINRTAISLLLETEADRTVAAYLVSAFDAEKPSDSLAKYMPEIAATERKLQLVAKRLKELAKLPELPKSTPLQRSLFDSIPQNFLDSSDSDDLPIPATISAARIGQSELAPLIFWALVKLRLSGKFFAIGVEITEIVNEYLVSDYDQKATNNISRTLRSKNMQSQAWLLTKKLTARQKAFGVKENWQTYWTEIFGEPAPILENDKQNGFGN